MAERLENLKKIGAKVKIYMKIADFNFKRKNWYPSLFDSNGFVFSFLLIRYIIVIKI